jgi:excisionase family DNA binding protein
MERLALSINEAAETLSLSPWTIRAWIKQGKLPAIKLGRRICVEPEALRNIVKQGTSRQLIAAKDDN